MSQSQENFQTEEEKDGRKDGRMDGQNLIHRTFPATAGAPTTADATPISDTCLEINISFGHFF